MWSCSPEGQDSAPTTRGQATVPPTRNPAQAPQPTSPTRGQTPEAKGTTILSLQKGDHKHSKSDKIR